MHVVKRSYPVDAMLTPHTAKKKGYHFIDDVFYSDTISPVVMQDIFMLIDRYGYKFGAPSQRNNYEGYVGLYMPIAS